MNFEKQVQEAVSLVHQYPNEKNIAIVAECIGLLDDIHSEIQERVMRGQEKFDLSVTVKVEGQKIKFQNIDDLAEWLHGKLD